MKMLSSLNASIELTQMCRVCMTVDKKPKSLLLKMHPFPKETYSILYECTSVNITPHDGKPQSICTQCYEQLRNTYNFREMCKKSDAEFSIRLKKHAEKSKHKLKSDRSLSPPDIIIKNENCDFDTYDVNEPLKKEYISNEQINLEPCPTVKLEYKTEDCEKIDNQTIVDHESINEYISTVLKNSSTIGTEGIEAFDIETTGKLAPILKCHMCEKSFPHKKNLVQHIRTHSTERPFKCSACDKKFKYQFALKEHEAKHTGKKPFICHQCNKAFAQQRILKDHMKVHTGYRPYICATCGKGFATSSQLIVHNRLHTGERPYMCDVCGASFKASGALRNHKRIVHRIKLFSCTKCDDSFLTSGLLKAHSSICRQLLNKKYPS